MPMCFAIGILVDMREESYPIPKALDDHMPTTHRFDIHMCMHHAMVVGIKMRTSHQRHLCADTGPADA
jgi:hypothetical protein